ncbi:hypothetical protein MKQ68_06980 [Chitinophaga horti]|uniref:Anti sigma-E protein RseA N-terminal domain-containing protein n=1 Tax=Chitinophaga horti TaxID=2920382 RepID=A0ABY6J574_9BACT|nr:hypothetical protein [Chitinophaga horti]UYQ94834.1 hypothetical protein MKQ68_06980 [Chitinophaga horti]
MEQFQIEQLMVKRLAGITSDSENALLDELVEKDAAAKALWEELCAMTGAKDMQAFAKSLDVESAWDELQTIVAPQKKYRLPLRSLSIAAAIAIMIGGAIYLLINPREDLRHKWLRYNRPPTGHSLPAFGWKRLTAICSPWMVRTPPLR